MHRGGRFYCLSLTDVRFRTDGGAQGLHSYNESDPNLHFTLSPSGSNAIKLKSLWQFEGTLKDKSYWLLSSLNVSFSSQLLFFSVDLEHKRLYVSLNLSPFWFSQSFCLSDALFMLPLFLTSSDCFILFRCYPSLSVFKLTHFHRRNKSTFLTVILNNIKTLSQIPINWRIFVVVVSRLTGSSRKLLLNFGINSKHILRVCYIYCSFF